MTVKRRASTPPDFTEPRFRCGFLAPRFWPSWCGLLVLRVMTHLPRTWVMSLGGWLGDWQRQRSHKRRRYAEINLALCFPELDAEARRRLLIEHFRQYGRGLLDLGLAFWGSRARLNELCEFERREWLLQTARRAPLIIVSYHMTALDIGGAALAGIYPAVAVMKRDKNPLLNWQLWRARVRRDAGNIEMLMRDQGLRRVVRLMRAGRIGVVVPDEDFGVSQNTVFAPFFGVPTSTLTSVARLAKITGARVVPWIARLDASRGRYAVIAGDPLPNFPSDDAYADAAAMNLAMENLIKQAPAQYMWTYQWFKTRPRGAPNPYKNSPAE